MLVHPLTEKLRQARLPGMAKAFEEQLQEKSVLELSFEDRFGLIVEKEIAARENRKLEARLKKAKFYQQASVENIEYRAKRGLDRQLVAKLSQCEWIKAHRNVLITGATGTGKTFLANALAHKACLEGYSSRYTKLSRLLPELALSKHDGRYLKIMRELEKIDVLILDDWGLMELNNDQRRDLLELFDDRHDKRSTIITSQLPVNLWHDAVGDKTLADAIIDRIIHNAYRFELSGESMRKVKGGIE